MAADRPSDGVSEMVPYWVYEGPAKIERHVPVLPFSREQAALPRLRKALALYRLAFGQPRQEELVEWLGANLTGEELYWADPGLVRAVKRQLGPVAAEERGALLEGWVLGLLRAHNEHQRVYDDIGYWAATESAAEVDFVLTRDREHLAIEVKASERYNTTMLKGLRAVADLPGLARRVLFYRGQRSFTTEDGIDVWPLDRLHQALGADGLWP